VLRLQACDSLSGETIKGVFFELTRQMEERPEEGLSDPHGSYEFALVSAGTYTIRTRKAGYLQTTRVL
jgi:CelD/BcsL family acetyltransferase involved in cellulose biosynthesis